MNAKLKITLVLLLMSGALKPQNTDPERPAIKWQNGDITLFNELGKVNITTNGGNDIKEVRLWLIDAAKGKLVYEKDGSLHDLALTKIAFVSAGKNSRNLLYFDENAQPVIKYNKYYFYDGPQNDFPVSKKFVPEAKKEEEEKSISGETQTTATGKNEEAVKPITLNNTHPNACDTIVRVTGELVPAKILSFSETELKYKRADNPDGPVYTVNKRSITRLVNYSNTKKIFLNK